MFINAHCHVFNMQAIYSSVSLDILRHRLQDVPLADWLKDALLDVVKDYVKGQEPSGLVELIASAFGAETFLKINLAKDLDKVADTLVRDTEKAIGDGTDMVLTPLMMDILPEDIQKPKHFDDLFRDQLKGTLRQSLRYPGRILPFVAVNPRRTQALFGQGNDMFSLMKEAVEEHGFIGVKLYPSVGYTLEDLRDFENREFFKYLSDNELPITMHANPEGSRAKLEYWQYCQPDKWQPFLDDYPGLRINFAHLGGGHCFTGYKNPRRLHTHVIWKDQILKLITDNPGRVFTDFSYHHLPFEDDDNSEKYFAGLKRLLDNEAYNHAVLFGTDYPLVLMDAEEDEYIKVFRNGLGDTRFRKVTETNPRRFLGFDDADGAPNMGWNITNFIEKMREARDAGNEAWALGAKPAEWLKPHLD